MRGAPRSGSYHMPEQTLWFRIITSNLKEFRTQSNSTSSLFNLLTFIKLIENANELNMKMYADLVVEWLRVVPSNTQTYVWRRGISFHNRTPLSILGWCTSQGTSQFHRPGSQAQLAIHCMACTHHRRCSWKGSPSTCGKWSRTTMEKWRTWKPSSWKI